MSISNKREKVPHNNRPISPHITIYRLQISSLLSILHRLSGIAMFFGLSLFIWWFILWTYNDFSADYLHLMQNLFVQIILFFLSLAGCYHTCNGIRHLIWDSGKCFSIKAINISGYVALIATLIFVLIVWLS